MHLFNYLEMQKGHASKGPAQAQRSRQPSVKGVGLKIVHDSGVLLPPIYTLVEPLWRKQPPQCMCSYDLTMSQVLKLDRPVERKLKSLLLTNCDGSETYQKVAV